MSMLSEALEYARLGLPVLPLARGKKIPLTTRGFYDATTDEDKINEWWMRTPFANIGVVVGAESGVLVLDVDNKGGKTGSAVLEKLERELGLIPTTYTVKTANGGLHYYFVFPSALEGQDIKKELGEGLDLKFNGYVVAPPSVIGNGAAYEIIAGSLEELAEFPHAILDLCIKEPPKIDRAEIKRRERRALEGASSICERYGLSMTDVLMIPSGARKTGEGYLFEHLIHGATGSGNLYVNTNKNLWACYRCGSGGDPLTWVAVREGLIGCADARSGCMDAETVKRCLEILRSEGTIPEESRPVMVTESDGSTVEIIVRGCDDIANVERFVSKHGKTLRYCIETAKWLQYNGKYWAEISATRVKHMARDVVTIIRHEAAEVGNLGGKENKEQRAKKEKIVEELNKWARTTSYKNRLEAITELSKQDLAVDASLFDRDPLLVNCDNATFDIRTGETRLHDPEDYLSHVSAPYVRGAKNDKWEAFLARVQPNAKIRAFLKRAEGYSATALTNEEALFLCYGLPATGKSTYLEAIAAAIGSYSQAESIKTFLSREDGDAGRPKPELLSLIGARRVSCIEVNKNTRWDSALINTLISGEKYRTRALYSNEPFEFNGVFKLWVGANHRPKVYYDPDAEDGIWRRLYVVPFEVVIPEEEWDTALKDYFTRDPAAKAAIFAWILEGAVEWYKLSDEGRRSGLKAPEAVRAARRDYQAAQSPIYEFIKSECQVGANERGFYEVAINDLWEIFSDVRKGYDTRKVKSSKSLSKYLNSLGFERFRDTKDKRYYWRGLKILGLDEECDENALKRFLTLFRKGTPLDDAALTLWNNAITRESEAELDNHGSLAHWKGLSENFSLKAPILKETFQDLAANEPMSHDEESEDKPRLNEGAQAEHAPVETVVREGENGEHYDIPRVRELILNVLTVIEQQNIGISMEVERLMSAIVTTVCTIEPNLSRLLTVETLQKMMIDRDFLSRLDNLTSGSMSTHIAIMGD